MRGERIFSQKSFVNDNFEAQNEVDLRSLYFPLPKNKSVRYFTGETTNIFTDELPKPKFDSRPQDLNISKFGLTFFVH